MSKLPTCVECGGCDFNSDNPGIVEDGCFYHADCAFKVRISKEADNIAKQFPDIDKDLLMDIIGEEGTQVLEIPVIAVYRTNDHEIDVRMFDSIEIFRKEEEQNARFPEGDGWELSDVIYNKKTIRHLMRRNPVLYLEIDANYEDQTAG